MWQTKDYRDVQCALNTRDLIRNRRQKQNQQLTRVCIGGAHGYVSPALIAIMYDVCM